MSSSGKYIPPARRGTAQSTSQAESSMGGTPYPSYSSTSYNPESKYSYRGSMSARERSQYSYGSSSGSRYESRYEQRGAPSGSGGYVPPSRRGVADTSTVVVKSESSGKTWSIPGTEAKKWELLKTAREPVIVDLSDDEIEKWYKTITSHFIYRLSELKSVVEYFGPLDDAWRLYIIFDVGIGIKIYGEWEEPSDYMIKLGKYIRSKRIKQPYHKPVEELIHGNFFLWRDPAFDNDQVFDSEASEENLEAALAVTNLNLITGVVHQAYLKSVRLKEVIPGEELPWDQINWGLLLPAHRILRVLQPLTGLVSRKSLIEELVIDPEHRSQGSGVRITSLGAKTIPIRAISLRERLTYTQQSLINYDLMQSGSNEVLKVLKEDIPPLVQYKLSREGAYYRLRMGIHEYVGLDIDGNPVDPVEALELISEVVRVNELCARLLVVLLADKTLKRDYKANITCLRTLMTRDKQVIPDFSDNLVYVIVREVIYQGRETYNYSDLLLHVPYQEYQSIFSVMMDVLGYKATAAVLAFLQEGEVAAPSVKKTLPSHYFMSGEVSYGEPETFAQTVAPQLVYYGTDKRSNPRLLTLVIPTWDNVTEHDQAIEAIPERSPLEVTKHNKEMAARIREGSRVLTREEKAERAEAVEEMMFGRG